MTFDRSFPAALVTEFAKRMDGRVAQLWVIEDCFYTTAPPLASAALAVTDDLTVGLGILPARARTAAITAMELATLCSLAPGRVIGGIGHGVQTWMAQMGVRPTSPLTALEEVLATVQALLRGETVGYQGRYVTADDIRLDAPPDPVPPILAGVRGPKSIDLAGRTCDGVLLADCAGPSFLPAARAQAGNPPGFQMHVFAPLITAPTRREAYQRATGWLADQLAAPTPSLRQMSFYPELVELASGGLDRLVDVPPQWWAQLGAIGTLEDAAAHIDNLEAAGATGVSLVPPPDAETALASIPDVVRLAERAV